VRKVSGIHRASSLKNVQRPINRQSAIRNRRLKNARGEN
jgi:hypothetical protein